MSSVNKVILIGRLGKDPEVRYTPSGAPVCSFSLATEERFKDKSGNQQSRTEWHQVKIWNKLGEACGEHLRKGSLVYLEGSIKSHEYETQSGEKRRAFEIVAYAVEFLTPKNEREQAPQPEQQRGDRPSSLPPGDEITDDDIPF